MEKIDRRKLEKPSRLRTLLSNIGRISQVHHIGGSEILIQHNGRPQTCISPPVYHDNNPISSPTIMTDPIPASGPPPPLPGATSLTSFSAGSGSSTTRNRSLPTKRPLHECAWRPPGSPPRIVHKRQPHESRSPRERKDGQPDFSRIKQLDTLVNHHYSRHGYREASFYEFDRSVLFGPKEPISSSEEERIQMAKIPGGRGAAGGQPVSEFAEGMGPRQIRLDRAMGSGVPMPAGPRKFPSKKHFGGTLTPDWWGFFTCVVCCCVG